MWNLQGEDGGGRGMGESCHVGLGQAMDLSGAEGGAPDGADGGLAGLGCAG